MHCAGLDVSEGVLCSTEPPGLCSSVQDLAAAFNLVLGNPKASQQIFNISGAKFVTFDGLARACAKVTRFRERNCTGFLLNCLGWVLLSSVFSNFSNGCDCLMRAGWRVP